MADSSWENRGPDNCDGCGVACHTAELVSVSSGELLCAGCKEARDRAEFDLLAESDLEWERNNADCSRAYEPRSAFL